MKTTPLIWMNGHLIPWEKAHVHLLTHTLHYGGGAFEGIRCYQTKWGTAIFRLSEHVHRLLYSVNTLKMPFSYSHEEICEAIKQTIYANQLEEGYIRPIVFYGYGKLGVNPTGNPVEFGIACWPWGSYLPHCHVDIKTSRYIRIHPKSTVIDAKLCGHYLNGILASVELQNTHYHEALFLDDQGYVSEGAGENFFMVKSGIIYTPPLDTILSGITRDTVFSMVKYLGMEVVQTHITLEQAYQADEAFFTGTAAEITPIRSIDDQIIGNGQVGALSSMVKENYADIVRGKKAEFLGYLTFVKEVSHKEDRPKSFAIPS